MLTPERLIVAVTARCLRSAAGRWPAAIRRDLHAAWCAELHMLRTEPGPWVLRAYRRLRFATSLALSPALPDQEGETQLMHAPQQPRRRPGLLLASASVVLATPVLSLIVGAVVFAVVEVVTAVVTSGGTMHASRFAFTTDPQAPLRVDWWLHLLSILGCAVSVVVSAGVGRWLGRRLPLRTPRSGGSGGAGIAMLAPVLAATGAAVMWSAAAGAALLWSAAGGLRTRTVTGSSGADIVAGGAVWVVVATAAAWWLLRRPAAWPRLALAILATAAAATTAAGLRPAAELGLGVATAPFWFPLSLLSPDGWAAADQPIPPLEALTSQLFDVSLLFLLCAALVLAFSIGSKAYAREPAPVAADPTGGLAVPQTAANQD